jgi:hypothetical protein
LIGDLLLIGRLTHTNRTARRRWIKKILQMVEPFVLFDERSGRRE